MDAAAKRAVEAHWPAIDAVAKRLIESGHVEGSELLEIVGRHVEHPRMDESQA